MSVQIARPWPSRNLTARRKVGPATDAEHLAAAGEAAEQRRVHALRAVRAQDRAVGLVYSSYGLSGHSQKWQLYLVSTGRATSPDGVVIYGLTKSRYMHRPLFRLGTNLFMTGMRRL